MVCWRCDKSGHIKKNNHVKKIKNANSTLLENVMEYFDLKEYDLLDDGL